MAPYEIEWIYQNILRVNKVGKQKMDGQIYLDYYQRGSKTIATVTVQKEECSFYVNLIKKLIKQ